jgi:hypothetical protein
MTHQEHYLKSARLFSPISYDRLEHFALNKGAWRMATFKTTQEHFAHHSSSEEVA